MKMRVFLSAGLIALSIAEVAGTFVQHRRIANLRAEEQRRSTRTAAPETAPEASAIPGPSPELLELRSQVSQLTERKRELSIASAGNAPPPIPAGPELPAGFIRKSQAQWVGTSHPEDTFQSAVWALHHRQLDTLLQLLEPGSAERLRQEIGNSPGKTEEFFRKAAEIPAMRLSNQQNFGAATIRARLELGPDDELHRTIFFFQLDGQWKIVLDNPDARFTR